MKRSGINACIKKEELILFDLMHWKKYKILRENEMFRKTFHLKLIQLDFVWFVPATTVFGNSYIHQPYCF